MAEETEYEWAMSRRVAPSLWQLFNAGAVVHGFGFWTSLLDIERIMGTTIGADNITHAKEHRARCTKIKRNEINRHIHMHLAGLLS